MSNTGHFQVVLGDALGVPLGLSRGDALGAAPRSLPRTSTW
jgi:hypothetical protein